MYFLAADTEQLPLVSQAAGVQDEMSDGDGMSEVGNERQVAVDVRGQVDLAFTCQ